VGISTLVIPLPRAASVLSAFGAATSDITHVLQRWSVVQLPVPGAEIEKVFAGLERETQDKFEAQGVSSDGASIQRSVRMRFSMQIHDVEVALGAGVIDDERLVALEMDFERIHEQLFGQGSGDRSGGIDITALQVRAVARSVKPTVHMGDDAASATSSRSVYWAELRGHADTPIHASVPRDRVEGPALIELPDTVVVVRPGQSGELDGHGNFVITLRSTP
jgi:N-methylhydantoinase A